MAVSKRTRFEVLRRDSHTCQYCGQAAPDVTLQIDHVVPVALGGSDAPANLITACRDCNAGKSSVPADAPIVAAVSSRSLEWAIAAKNRMAHLDADMQAMEQYEEEFQIKWNGYTYRQGIKDVHLPIPADWRATLKGWWRIGVPKSLLESAVTTAMGAGTVDNTDRFRYFCGVVWRTLDDYDQRYPEQTATARVYGPDEIDEFLQSEWRHGVDAGRRAAERDAVKNDLLRQLIDGELAVA